MDGRDAVRHLRNDLTEFSVSKPADWNADPDHLRRTFTRVADATEILATGGSISSVPLDKLDSAITVTSHQRVPVDEPHRGQLR